MSSRLQRSTESDPASRGHDQTGPSSPVANGPNDDWPKPSGFDLDGDGAPDPKEDDSAPGDSKDES